MLVSADRAPGDLPWRRNKNTVGGEEQGTQGSYLYSPSSQDLHTPGSAFSCVTCQGSEEDDHFLFDFMFYHFEVK